MAQEPFDLLERVRDETSFVVSLAALATDRANGSEANGWENGTIDEFLASAARWAEESRYGLPLAGYTPSSNPWRRCADIIYAGKIYE
jgi:hypothetical protein